MLHLKLGHICTRNGMPIVFWLVQRCIPFEDYIIRVSYMNMYPTPTTYTLSYLFLPFCSCFWVQDLLRDVACALRCNALRMEW